MKRVIWCKTAAIALAIAAAAIMLPRDGSPQTGAPAAAPASAEAVKRGEAWFYQRCSLCHMGRIVKDDVYEPMAPKLTLKGATPAREKAVRDQIQRGSPRMPGFQYTFTPAEFEELIVYMKTL
jgi:mono/diheme cytochrome c family protein